MTEHTPGPWRVVLAGVDTIPVGFGGGGARDSDDGWFHAAIKLPAEFEREEPFADGRRHGLSWAGGGNIALVDSQANAEFIVRAVNSSDDLLTALEEAEVWLDDGAPNMALEILHGAIKKARA